MRTDRADRTRAILFRQMLIARRRSDRDCFFGVFFEAPPWIVSIKVDNHMNIAVFYSIRYSYSSLDCFDLDFS
jgi:hypothetical protein